MRRDASFANLARANALARGGRYREAATEYDALLRDHREHPALLMNQAMAHARGGDTDGALPILERSIAACNHYVPVLRMLHFEAP